MKCYVYFVQKENSPNGPVKIGHASDIQRRLIELQTGNPHKLVIKAAILCETRSDAAKLENSIHWIAEKRFTRLQGEWFLIQGSWRKLIEQAMKSSRKHGEKLTKKEVLKLACDAQEATRI